MTSTPENSDHVLARALKERRKFRRVKLAFSGRLYIPATQEEAVCTIDDISPGDAAILCELKQAPHDRAVLYLDGLGRFEGPIVRREPTGFIMTFTCSAQKREKLADQLALELNRHFLADSDMRRHDRVEQASGNYTHYTRSTGEQIRCEVLDLSLTGVSLRTEARPPVGEHILIGQRAGRVARHHGDGIGIEFLVPATAATANLNEKMPLTVMPGASAAFKTTQSAIPMTAAGGSRW